MLLCIPLLLGHPQVADFPAVMVITDYGTPDFTAQTYGFKMNFEEREVSHKEAVEATLWQATRPKRKAGPQPQKMARRPSRSE